MRAVASSFSDEATCYVHFIKATISPTGLIANKFKDEANLSIAAGSTGKSNSEELISFGKLDE